MKIIFCALFLTFLPAVAHACLIAPEEATREQVKAVPEGYVGLQGEILSLSAPEESLPHGSFTAKVRVTENFGRDLPETITLSFGPCSVLPQTGAAYYFLTTVHDGIYTVEDHPSRIIKNAAP